MAKLMRLLITIEMGTASLGNHTFPNMLAFPTKVFDVLVMQPEK